jgi:hypothetical protein
VEIAGVNHASSEAGVSVTVNQLFIGTVTRDMYGTKIECRAQSSKLLPPVMKEVTIQVYRRFIENKSSKVALQFSFPLQSNQSK